MSDLKFGIDISEHNVISSVQWDTLRAENDFCIIRACWGTNEDKSFRAHYEQAKARGFKIGLYVYSYALNDEQARSESDYLYNLSQGLQLDLGLWFDMEDADGYKAKRMAITRQAITSMCNQFTAYMLSKGVDTYGVYASESWFNTYIDTACKRWLASWGTNSGRMEFVKDEYIHQFTSEYIVGGKRFDRNASKYIEGGQAPINPPTSNVISVGDTVRPTKAISYDGVQLAGFVTSGVYKVIEVKGNRAVLDTIMTAFNTTYLEKVGATTPTGAKPFNIGEYVRPTKAISYDGVPLVDYVTSNYYPVIQVDGERVVLGGIVTAFHSNNLAR